MWGCGVLCARSGETWDMREMMGRWDVAVGCKQERVWVDAARGLYGRVAEKERSRDFGGAGGGIRGEDMRFVRKSLFERRLMILCGV